MTAFTLILQVTLLLYHQATTRFDFFPFNGARFCPAHERQVEATVNLVLMSLPPLGFLGVGPVLLNFGAAYYFVLFAVECATWWGPYFLGPSTRCRELYERVHRPTLTLVPRRGSNPVPNLEHLILMALTLTTAIITWLTYREIHPAPFPVAWVAWLIGCLFTGGTLYQFVVGRA